MPQTAPRLSSTCLSCHIREEYCICIAAEAIVLRRVEKQRRGPACHFHVIIPAALVAGEAQRPPREEKSTVRTVATLPAELLYGLTKLPSSKPALPLSTRHRLLCPVLPVLPSYGPMFHFSQLKTEGGNARKSARRVRAWLWLGLAGSLPQPKASRYTSALIGVPHQFHPEICGNICRSFHCWGAAVPCGWRWELKGERRDVEKRPALRCLVPTK
jgi:hypothetical protein